MKKHFSRFIGLSVLIGISTPILGQPQEAAVPKEIKNLDNKRSQLNASALALIGSFYDKVRRAKSYRGRMVIETTNTKNGEVVYRSTAEIKSSVIHDSKREGNPSKIFTEYSTQRFQDNRTTLEKFSSLYDGAKNYRVNEIEKLWSVRNQEATPKSVPVDFALLPWSDALTFFEAGIDFGIYAETIDGREQISVRNKGSIDFKFDAETGNLLSYSQTGRFNDSTRKTEYRWLDTEFDVPLQDEVFTWKVPQNAKEVAAETMRFYRPF